MMTKATKAELRQIKKLAKTANNTPVVMIGGIDLSTAAWEILHKYIYSAALSNGLPEIDGYYGVNTATGEFISPEDFPQ